MHGDGVKLEIETRNRMFPDKTRSWLYAAQIPEILLTHIIVKAPQRIQYEWLNVFEYVHDSHAKRT